MASKQAKQIVKSKLPGYRVVEQEQPPVHAAPDAVTDYAALRSKFGATPSVGPAKKDADDEIVTIEPEVQPEGQDRAAARKVVVVSKKDKGIIGMQG
jgi:hypothetical protein